MCLKMKVYGSSKILMLKSVVSRNEIRGPLQALRHGSDGSFLHALQAICPTTFFRPGIFVFLFAFSLWLFLPVLTSSLWRKAEYFLSLEYSSKPRMLKINA